MRSIRRRWRPLGVIVAILFLGAGVAGASLGSSEEGTVPAVRIVLDDSVLDYGPDDLRVFSAAWADTRLLDVVIHEPDAVEDGLHLRLMEVGEYRGLPLLWGLAAFSDPVTGERWAGQAAAFDTSEGRRELDAAVHDNRTGRRVPFRLVLDIEPVSAPSPG